MPLLHGSQERTNFFSSFRLTLFIIRDTVAIEMTHTTTTRFTNRPAAQQPNGTGAFM